MTWNDLGLQGAPFEDDAHQEGWRTSWPQRDRLRDAALTGLREHRGVIVLVGESGIGKTLLANEIADSLAEDDRCVFFSGEDDGGTLVQRVCSKFNVAISETASTAEGLATLRRCIEEDDPARRLHVVVVDSSERLSDVGLQQLNTLSRLRCGDAYGLQLVIVGQPEVLSLLQATRCPDIGKRVVVAEKLDPLPPEEVANYIRHRVAAAGADGDQLFTPSALQQVATWTGGNPRQINELAGALIDAARRADKSLITGEMVEPLIAEGDTAAAESFEDATGEEAPGESADEVAPTASSPEPDTREDAPSPADSANAVTSTSGLATGLEGRLQELSQRAEQAIEQLRTAVEMVEGRARRECENVDTREIDGLLERLGRMTVHAGEKAQEIEARLADLISRTEGAAESLQAVSADAEARSTSAVEHRLGQLVGDADAAIARLRDTSSDIENRCLQAIEERVRQVVGQADEALASLRESSSEIDGQRSAVAARIVKIEECRARADETLERLAETAQQIESIGDEAQEKVNLLASGLEAGEATHQKLTDLSEEVARLTAEFRQTTEEHLDELRSSVDNFATARAQTAQMCEETMARMEEKSRAIVEQSDAAAEILRGRIELAQGESEEVCDQLVTRIRQAVESEIMPAVRKEMHAAQAAAIDAVKASIEDRHSEADAWATRLCRSFESKVEQIVGDRTKSLESQLAEMEDRLSHADQVSTNMTLGLQSAEAKAKQLASQVSAASNIIQVLSDTSAESQDAVRAVSASAEEAKRLREEMASECSSVIERVTNTGDAAHQKLTALLGRVEDVSERAVQNEQSLQEQRQAIEEIIERANQVSEHAEHSVHSLDETIQNVDTRIDTVRMQLDELNESLASRIGTASSEMEETAAKTQREVGERLEAALGQVDQRQKALDAEVERRVQDAFERLNHERETSVRELESRMNEGFERVGRYREDVAEQLKQAKVMQAQMTTAAEEARERAELIQKHAEEARQLLAEQANQNRSHRQLFEQMRDQIRRGESITSEFEGIKDGAMEAYTQLAERSDEAARLFEKTSELIRKVDEREEEIEMQGRVLTTLCDEREALELRIQQLQTMIESMRVELNSVLAEPQRLVCDAKNQAVRLQDVCRAVKKVFSGLSQASLQANQRIEQLKRLETVATALQGWVQETASAQQRLSSVLTPSLTGPGAAMASIVQDGQGRTSVIGQGDSSGTKNQEDRQDSAADAQRQARAKQIDTLIRKAREQLRSTPQVSNA